MLVQLLTQTQLVHYCTLGGADAADNYMFNFWKQRSLSIRCKLDYENPADADGNNIYVVTVLADDDNANDPNGATTLTLQLLTRASQLLAHNHSVLQKMQLTTQL